MRLQGHSAANPGEATATDLEKDSGPSVMRLKQVLPTLSTLKSSTSTWSGSVTLPLASGLTYKSLLPPSVSYQYTHQKLSIISCYPLGNSRPLSSSNTLFPETTPLDMGPEILGTGASNSTGRVPNMPKSVWTPCSIFPALGQPSAYNENDTEALRHAPLPAIFKSVANLSIPHRL